MTDATDKPKPKKAPIPRKPQTTQVTGTEHKSRDNPPRRITETKKPKPAKKDKG